MIPSDRETGNGEMLHKETDETQDTYETEGNAGTTSKYSETERKERIPAGQTLRQFLVQAIEKAIEATTGDVRQGKWRTPCFQLARQLKAHPELGPLPTAKVIEKIERIIREWERAQGFDFWRKCFGVSRDCAHTEILDVWHQIRRLPGKDALANAAEFSRRMPLSRNKESFEKRGRSKKYCEFLSLCGWLQVTVGPGTPIAIPCRDFGERIGVEPMTISRFRKWALQDGLLMEVEKHKFLGTAAKNRGTSFFFAYHYWSILAKYAEGRMDR